MASLTVVTVVFVSLGCVLFVGICLFALWFLIKRRCKKTVKEADIIRADENFKVKEDIVKGPRGQEAVVVTIEKDKRFEEEIIKNEREIEGKLMQEKAGKITATDVESGKSSSNPIVLTTNFSMQIFQPQEVTLAESKLQQVQNSGLAIVT